VPRFFTLVHGEAEAWRHSNEAVKSPSGGRPARGAVRVRELHVADREAERVQAPEDNCERLDSVHVHDQLPGVRASVEAVVANREDAQL
jgi:hypothetical protein